MLPAAVVPRRGSCTRLAAGAVEEQHTGPGRILDHAAATSPSAAAEIAHPQSGRTAVNTPPRYWINRIRSRTRTARTVRGIRPEPHPLQADSWLSHANRAHPSSFIWQISRFAEARTLRSRHLTDTRQQNAVLLGRITGELFTMWAVLTRTSQQPLWNCSMRTQEISDVYCIAARHRLAQHWRTLDPTPGGAICGATAVSPHTPESIVLNSLALGLGWTRRSQVRLRRVVYVCCHDERWRWRRCTSR
jgi:hypothetical protein